MSKLLTIEEIEFLANDLREKQNLMLSAIENWEEAKKNLIRTDGIGLDIEDCTSLTKKPKYIFLVEKIRYEPVIECDI